LSLAYTQSPVSSLISQGTEFPLKKPAGFHWDLFLLGLTTGVAGLLGLPFPNGLIPQAPFHTEALTVKRTHVERDEKGEQKSYVIKAEHVVEQRFSNLAQGLLTLGTMTGPLLVVLHLIPHGVLAGLFFVMGVQALEANGITTKLVFLGRDAALTPKGHPLRKVKRRAALWEFVVIELVGFGVTFAITQTVAAVGFPVFIMLLIPIRAVLLPRWFTAEELAALDEPTASLFTMESVGGVYGAANVTGGNGNHRREGGDGVFAMPGGPRRSQEQLAELGQIRSGELGSTATRRRSSIPRADSLEIQGVRSRDSLRSKKSS
jgi:boron transporter